MEYSEIRPIQVLLSRLRLWLNLERLAHALFPSLAGLLLWALFGFLWHKVWGGGFFPSLSFLLFSLALSGWIIIRYWWRPFRERFHDEAIALKLERTFTDLDSRLISTVQFQEAKNLERLNHETSLLFVRALQKETVQALEKKKTKAVISWKPSLQWGGLVLLLTVLFLTGQHFFPDQISQALAVLLNPQALTPGQRPFGAKNKTSDWAIGDIRLLYTYPKYTGLPRRVEENTDGSIQALKGTLVRIEATSSARLDSAQLVLDTGERFTLNIEEDGRGIRGEINLMKSGAYSFHAKLTLKKGRDSERTSREYIIEVLNDNFPKVVLEEPLDDLEINEVGKVQIKYFVEDDFGLNNLDLMVQKGDKKWQVAQFQDPKRLHSGSYTWNIKEVDLKPGEDMGFFLRIFDNDTVSGPKSSDSAVRYLSILSDRKIRHDLLVRQEEIFEEMIHTLGDHLEFNDSPRTNARTETLPETRKKMESLRTRVNRIIEDLNQVAISMAQNQSLDEGKKVKDDLKVQAIEGISRQLARVEAGWARIVNRDSLNWDQENWRRQGEKGIERALREGRDGFEDSILMFETLIYGQRVDEVMLDGDKVMENLEDLQAAMENLSSDNLASAQKILEQFEKSYLDYARKMAQASTQTPMEEFVNMDALKELQDNSIAATLKKIREMLNRGDLKGAQEEMAKLQEQMKESMKGLKSSGSEKQEKQIQQLNEDIEKLDETIAGQEHLLKETEEFRDQLKKRHQKEQMAQYKEFLKRQLKRIKSIRKNLDTFEQGLALQPEENIPFRKALGLDNEISDALEGLERELEQRDVEDAKLKAEETAAYLRRLRDYSRAVQRFSSAEKDPIIESVKPVEESVQSAEAIIADLGEILNSLRSGGGKSVSPQEQAKVDQLVKGQEGIRKRSMEIADRLAELSKDLPFLNEDFFGEEKGDDRMPDMKKAQENLKNGEVSGSVPHERSGLYRLKGARDKLQKSLDQAKQQEQGKGSGGAPLPGSIPSGRLMGEGKGEGEGSADQDVDIPASEEYKVPEDFRREILDAMKKPVPKGYEKLDREYYERLVR